ncbi:hypothetical protein GOBAR_AA16028 [Gossypium barbadense]|uniref:BFN domain-containing protein n=1 Tax=Gossypium barbadense TaxID=3634 RepID=A0A2P5XMU5_GOSBA|nr:hypothetical protein GOBAR_AA16028 [Gossypium barbadense]
MVASAPNLVMVTIEITSFSKLLFSSQDVKGVFPMSRAKITSIGQAFLSRFPSPTIFLKIPCDGEFLLPIVVGEFSVEKLIAAFWGDDKGDTPDQFQLVNNVVEKLGYEVKMVRITERVVNTYFAKLYFSKPGENDVIIVDARPSDAINVANRCKAPIYVNKQIVLADAIRIGYGMGRVLDKKSTYDVSLDSAADGPDFLLEELDLVRNMDLAVKEERYTDAELQEGARPETHYSESGTFTVLVKPEESFLEVEWMHNHVLQTVVNNATMELSATVE